MVSQLLITITLTCSSPQLNGEILNTTHGNSATQQLQALPRNDSTWATLGTLFANRIFMLKSTDKRRDADSALFYFRKAQAVCPNNPVIAAYIAVSTGLRAKEDGLWRKITGKTESQAHAAFVTMDSLRQAYPANLAVQFLSACLLSEASKHFEDAYAFKLTSYETLQKLHREALTGSQTRFFTVDVRGHILLGLANVVRKLESHQKAEDLSCQYIEELLAHFPNSTAAEYARERKLRCE